MGVGFETIFKKLVLPDPLCPINATLSPLGITQLTFDRAFIFVTSADSLCNKPPVTDLIMLFFIENKKYEKEIEYNLINEDIGLNERI